LSEQRAKDHRFLDKKETFLKRAYHALNDHFSSYDTFVAFFDAISGDDAKNRFLRTASFYLFLVKGGDWLLDLPDSDKRIDYLTNTYKYVAIFSLIESLSEEQYIDFYQFLRSKKTPIEFPIKDKQTLDQHFKNYTQDYGSIRRCTSFFKSLGEERQRDLLSRFEIRGTEPTIENVAKYLYTMRSKFVHEGDLVLHMGKEVSIGIIDNKPVICSLTINDAMRFFEEGLIVYFRARQPNKKS